MSASLLFIIITLTFISGNESHLIKSGGDKDFVCHNSGPSSAGSTQFDSILNFTDAGCNYQQESEFPDQRFSIGSKEPINSVIEGPYNSLIYFNSYKKLSGYSIGFYYTDSSIPIGRKEFADSRKKTIYIKFEGPDINQPFNAFW